MPRWLRRTENDHGEWSVTDLRRGYRICRYNHGSHEGVHVHHPIDADPVLAVGPEAIPSAAAAEHLARRYADEHEVLEADTFQEVVDAWRSGSNDG